MKKEIKIFILGFGLGLGIGALMLFILQAI